MLTRPEYPGTCERVGCVHRQRLLRALSQGPLRVPGDRRLQRSFHPGPRPPTGSWTWWGKHVRVHWVHDGNDSDFYDVPGEYDVNGDGINVVKVTQVERSTARPRSTSRLGRGSPGGKASRCKRATATRCGLVARTLSRTPLDASSRPIRSRVGQVRPRRALEGGLLGHPHLQKRIKVPTSQLVGKTTTFDWKYDDMNYHPLPSRGTRQTEGTTRSPWRWWALHLRSSTWISRNSPCRGGALGGARGRDQPGPARNDVVEVHSDP